VEGLRNIRQSAAIALAAGLAAVALAAVLWAVATAAPLGFLHVRFNLSQMPARVSAQPDLAVNAGGNWVAAVWTEEYTSGIGQAKGHVYLRAASETGAGWGNKIQVFTGTSSACAVDAAVAITDTTAHVAYVVFNDTCANPSQMQVRHRTCSLIQGQCSTQADEVTAVGTDSNRITWVDLALDAAGKPHIVWPQYDKDGKQGWIYYRGAFGDHWTDPEPVASSGDNHAPAIAYADNYLHVVWTDQLVQGDDIKRGIYYRRRPTTGPGAAWESSTTICPQQVGPNNPDVAAGLGKVFVVWDWCLEYVSNPKSCAGQYNLVYRRSTDSGAHWGLLDQEIREVGTDYLRSGLDELTQYSSLDRQGSPEEYLDDLQPSIALNRYGRLAVAWQADRSGGDGTDYTIYYSYALTGTDWTTSTVLYHGQPTMWSVPVIGVGEPAPGEPHLHVAYMQKLSASAWDVYYDSNESAKYRYHYLPLVMKAYLH